MQSGSLMNGIRLVLALGLALCLSAFAVTGCSDDDGGGGTGGEGNSGSSEQVSFAEITLIPANVRVSLSSGIGIDAPYTIAIQSDGNLALRVDGIELDYTATTPDEEFPAFRLGELRGCKLPGCPSPDVWKADGSNLADLKTGIGKALEVDTEGAAEYTFLEVQVLFRRAPTAAERKAVLRVRSNADGQAEAVATISESVGRARIEVAPLVVDFQEVKASEFETRVVGINNSGSDALIVDRIEFQGSDFFRLKLDEQEYAPGGVVTFDPPLSIAPQDSDTFELVFTPLDGQPATATARIFSNDPLAPSLGVLVEIRGNTSGPCIQTNPSQTLAFGPRNIGTPSSLPLQIINCGNAPLEVYEVLIEDGSSLDFGLDFTSLPGFEAGGSPTDEAPLIVGVNQVVDLTVTFVPDEVNPTTEAGEVIPDVGIVVLRNNTFDQFRDVEITGVGIDSVCPEAVIFIPEGEEVIPQTTLHLQGAQSKAVNGGQIVDYTWSVDQPEGNGQVFQPSNKVDAPQFVANVAGVYRFELEVVDSEGNKSCEPDVAEVAVIPDEAIHVELIWQTPNDPDPTDEGAGKGADLDLHFAHPFAATTDVDENGEVDPWFDQPFDCFWFNKEPDWEVIGELADNPSLDRDDTDGLGPENLNLDQPADGATYRIGVHYWNDHGFGSSLATVRIYLYSIPMWEEADVLLEEYDMWEAATIEWPSGTTLPVLENGELRILKNYINPFFPQPSSSDG